MPATLPFTLGAAEKGGFMRMTLGRSVSGQIVVNLLGVEARDGDGREQQRKQIGACVGDLVERERCAVKLGEDGELTGSGRGLEHQIGGRDRGRERRDEAKLDGRGELLELLAFLRAARVGRRERGELAQHVEQPRVRSRAAAHACEVAAQEEQLRCLARLVGVLPHPGAFAVRGAECFGHRFAERARVERLRRVRAMPEEGRGRLKQARAAGHRSAAGDGAERAREDWAASETSRMGGHP